MAPAWRRTPVRRRTTTVHRLGGTTRTEVGRPAGSGIREHPIRRPGSCRSSTVGGELRRPSRRQACSIGRVHGARRRSCGPWAAAPARTRSPARAGRGRPPGPGRGHALRAESNRSAERTQARLSADEALDLVAGASTRSATSARAGASGRARRRRRCRVRGSGRPTPTRTRWKSAQPSSRLSDSRPLWPASPPPSRVRISPNGRSISSWTATSGRGRLVGPRAGPTERPASFMKVCGRSTATRGPPGPVRPSASSPANFFFGSAGPSGGEHPGHLEADVVRASRRNRARVAEPDEQPVDGRARLRLLAVAPAAASSAAPSALPPRARRPHRPPRSRSRSRPRSARASAG